MLGKIIGELNFVSHSVSLALSFHVANSPSSLCKLIFLIVDLNILCFKKILPEMKEKR